MPPGPEVGVRLLMEAGAETTIVVVDALQLFDSFDSTITAVSSAHAPRKYVPGVIPDGIVTLTEPDELEPFFNDGTALLPVSSVSALVITLSTDNRYRVVEALAVALPEFPVVSVTEKLVAKIPLAGGFVMLLTTRSGKEVAA